MKILNLQQGTAEWREARRGKFCASDAPAMMGVSQYETRDELLARYATGVEKEISPAQQALFNRGHAAEAAARAIIEAEIGETLYPVTCVSDDGKYLASMDGLTMDGKIGFEHKLWNEALASEIKSLVVKRGEEDYLSAMPKVHGWQIAHQFLVTGAKQIIFVVSDGADKREEITFWHDDTEVYEAILQVKAGWEQFAKDLENWKPKAPIVEAVPVANPIGLPAIRVEAEGKVIVRSNLDEVRERMQAFVAGINYTPKTDEDFVALGVAAKELSKAEEKLQQVSDMLDAAANIDDAKKAVNDIYDEVRAHRLRCEKLEKEGKDNRKRELITAIRNEWKAFVSDGLQRLGVNIAIAEPDFIGAVKGVKTLESYQSKLNDCIAQGKIAANELLATATDNLKLINDGNRFLFPDVAQLITKSKEDFANLVVARVTERERLEAEALIKEAANNAAQAAQSVLQKSDPTAKVSVQVVQEQIFTPATNQFNAQREALLAFLNSATDAELARLHRFCAEHFQRFLKVA